MFSLHVLMDDESMEGAENPGAQDDKQDDQGGGGLAGIASRFTIFDGEIGVGDGAAGSYVDSSCASGA